MPAEAAEPRRAELRCWLGEARLPAEERARLSRLSRSEDVLESGRALSLLGRLSAASGALERAAAAPARRPAALAWRAELELARGGADAALAHADAALALEPVQPYARLFRAASCWRLGRGPEAERELERLPPGWRSARGLGALLAAQRGDASGARRLLDRALKDGRDGWLLALRAALRARGGELAAARRDIEDALALEDSPWVRLERADIARRMGEYWVALEDLRRARRRLPRETEPLRRLAGVLLDQAQYARALAAVRGLLRLSPSDAGALHQRTIILLMQGRLQDAASAARAAAARRPDEPALREALVSVLSIAGRLEEAAAAATALAPEARAFWDAYALCRRGRRAEAARGFAQAARLSPEGSERAARARLYATAAAVLDGLSPLPAPKGRELLVVGLGYRQVQHVTAAGLQALLSCERFFVNHSDPRVAEFLGLFAAPFEAVVFRGTDNQAETSARRVMTGFARGCRRVAMVTRGQPIVYGLFAWELGRCADRAGVPWRLTPSVSIFDMAPAQAAAGPRPGGLFVRDAADMDGLAGETPFVLYTPKAADSEAPRRLEKLLEPERRCHLFPGGGENEFEPISFERTELGRRLDACDKACTLFVSAPARVPARAAAPRPAAPASPPSVRVDERLELLALARAAAEGRGAAFGSGAHAEAARAFVSRAAGGRAAKEAAEALARARRLGLDDTWAAVLLMHCAPPPKLTLTLESHPWTGFSEQRALAAELPRVTRALAAFARESGFAAFVEERRKFYEGLARPLAEEAGRLAYARELERYTGLPFAARYSILLSPLLPPGFRANHVHGHDEVWSAVGPASPRSPERLSLPHPWKIWHELGRTVLDRLLEPHAELIAGSQALWARARGRVNGASSWRHCLAEHFSQCVALRVWEESGAAKAAGARRPRLEGLPYSALVLRGLSRFERRRSGGKTLADFYPDLLQGFVEEAA